MDRSLVVIYDIDSRRSVLIDSGYSESPELIELMKSRGRRVSACLCTHFHVDHMGNNGLLQKAYGAKIYASALEIEVQKKRYESDEGSSFEWMDRDKYFFGESGKYRTRPVAEDQREVNVDGARFAVEKLYGHSPAHLGFATPDGVLHVGDAFMTDRVLRHSKVPYELNITKTLDTLEKIRHMDYPYFAASHMGIVEQKDIGRVIGANIDYHESMLSYIESRLGRSWENMQTFIMEIIENRGVNIKRSSNIGWIPAAVRSYIDHLALKGKVVFGNEDGEKIRPVSTEDILVKQKEALSAYSVYLRRA